MRVALAAIGVVLIAAAAGGAAGAPRAKAAPSIVELAWSPNGKWLAYLVGKVEGGYSLNVVRADRAVQRRMVRTTHPDSLLMGIAWAPDSKQLAVRQYGARCVTWISAANGRNARQTEGCFEDWSPDSRRFVLYREADRSLYVVDGRSGESRFLAEDAEDPVSGEARWSPDGARIAFARFASGSGSRVFSIRANGSDLRQEGVGPAERANQIVAGWSRDSTQLAYVEYHGITDFVSKAFVVAADGSRRSTQISDSSRWLFWSPGGRRLAVLEFSHGNFGARIAMPSGATVATLPNVVEVAWRPNGGSVVFRGVRPWSGWGVYTARADGKGTRRLGPGHLPAWSKLGWIAYAYRGACSDGAERVYVVRPNGTQRHVMSRCRPTG
jgi:dipeptidyl aminopeptidase/acylaminoacyl peptidase